MCRIRSAADRSARRWETRQRSAWAQRTPVELDRQGRGVPAAAAAARLGFRLHRVPRPPRRAVVRLRIRRPVRRLSLGLRQLPLDGEVRRSRFPVSRRRGEALGADGDAAGERRRGAAALLVVCARPAGGSRHACAAMRSAARARRSIPHRGQKAAITPDFSRDRRGARRIWRGGRRRGQGGRRRCRERRRGQGEGAQRHADPGRARVPQCRGPAEAAVVPPHADRARTHDRLRAWPFPALQQAIEERDAAMFASEAKRVVAAIKAGTERLRAAAK